MQFFRDCESGGAWPFLVRGVNCLLNCDNGRDLCLVTERRPFRPVPAAAAAAGEGGGGVRGRWGRGCRCVCVRVPGVRCAGEGGRAWECAWEGERGRWGAGGRVCACAGAREHGGRQGGAGESWGC